MCLLMAFLSSLHFACLPSLAWPPLCMPSSGFPFCLVPPPHFAPSTTTCLQLPFVVILWEEADVMASTLTPLLKTPLSACISHSVGLGFTSPGPLACPPPTSSSPLPTTYLLPHPMPLLQHCHPLPLSGTTRKNLPLLPSTASRLPPILNTMRDKEDLDSFWHTSLLSPLQVSDRWVEMGRDRPDRDRDICCCVLSYCALTPLFLPATFFFSFSSYLITPISACSVLYSLLWYSSSC